jgi:hypothetical protein
LYEQDYILRLAKQLAAMLARVLGLRREGATEEALAELDGAYGELFGLPPGLVDVIPAAELARLLSDPQKIAMMAELLAAEASALEAAGRQEAAARRRKLAGELGGYLPADR